MQYTRIVAVRHGETDWNAQRRIQGSTDIPLNPRGRWQAERVAAALAGEPVTGLYSSGLARADNTALAIARSTGVPLLIDRGLGERQLGVFEGKTFDEVETNWPEDALAWRRRVPEWQPPGGGESLLQLRHRIESTLQALAERHAGGLLVLVTHGGVLDLVYRLATRQAMDSPRTWQLENAALNRLLWSAPGGLSLVGWADTQHLDDALDDSATVPA